MIDALVSFPPLEDPGEADLIYDRVLQTLRQDGASVQPAGGWGSQKVNTYAGAQNGMMVCGIISKHLHALAIVRLSVDWQKDIMALEKAPSRTMLSELARIEDDERQKAMFNLLLEGKLTRAILRNEVSATPQAETLALNVVTEAAEAQKASIADDETSNQTPSQTVDGRKLGSGPVKVADVREGLRALQSLVNRVPTNASEARSAEWRELLRMADDISKRLHFLHGSVPGST